MSTEMSERAADRIDAFLRKARRRLFLRLALWSLLWAAVFSEIWIWGTVAVSRMLGAELPVYKVGYLLAAILLVIHWRRARPATVAARADRQLGLKDRLVSFLDFAGRPDVDPAFRGAQAQETAEVITGADLTKGFRINPLLWLSPAVFLVLTTWFLFEKMPDPSLVTVKIINLVLRKSGGPGKTPAGEEPRQESGPSVMTAVIKERETPKEEGGKETSPENPTVNPPPELKPETLEKRDTKGDAVPQQQIFQPPTDEASAAGGVKRPSGGASDLEMVQLFSETVGKELTPVVVGRNTAAPQTAAPAPPPPRGRQAFNLIPRSRAGASAKKGTGFGGGETDKTLEIIVDFDAVPPEYRDFVRRYFLELQKGG